MRSKQLNLGDWIRAYITLPYPGIEEVTGVVVKMNTDNTEVQVLTNDCRLVWVRVNDTEILQQLNSGSV